MGFMKELFPDSDPPPNEHDELPTSIPMQSATRLANHFTYLQSTRVPQRLGPWAKKISRLISTHGSPHVEKTITYLLNHYADEYIPQVRSIDSFVQKFDRLKELMLQSVDFVVVSERAREWAERFKYDKWPAHYQQSLPAVIELSLQNMAQGRVLANTLRTTLATEMKPKERPKVLDNATTRAWHTTRRLFHTLDYLLKAGFFADSFLEYWFDQQRKACWGGYSPNVEKIVFRLGNARHNKLMEKEVYDWCGNGELWLKILELLTEKTSEG